MMGFKSDCRQLFLEKLIETSLSPYDDKRFILEDEICSLAYMVTVKLSNKVEQLCKK